MQFGVYPLDLCYAKIFLKACLPSSLRPSTLLLKSVYFLFLISHKKTNNACYQLTQPSTPIITNEP